MTLEKKVADNTREESDVEEFIRRLKRYTDVSELTRGKLDEVFERSDAYEDLDGE